MSADLITPLEAFRVILRARYPERPDLADEITELRWFHYHGTFEEHAAAWAADALLHAKVRNGEVRLRGVLKPSDAPADIDFIDASAGELRLFEGTLVFYPKDSSRIEKQYRNVHCVAEDVHKIIAPDVSLHIEPPAARGRKKRLHQQDLVRPILKELWPPHGQPSLSEIGNVALCKQVQDLLGKDRRVSDRTIVRTAGRGTLDK